MVVVLLTKVRKSTIFNKLSFTLPYIPPIILETAKGKQSAFAATSTPMDRKLKTVLDVIEERFRSELRRIRPKLDKVIKKKIEIGFEQFQQQINEFWVVEIFIGKHLSNGAWESARESLKLVLVN